MMFCKQNVRHDRSDYKVQLSRHYCINHSTGINVILISSFYQDHFYSWEEQLGVGIASIAKRIYTRTSYIKHVRKIILKENNLYTFKFARE